VVAWWPKDTRQTKPDTPGPNPSAMGVTR